MNFAEVVVRFTFYAAVLAFGYWWGYDDACWKHHVGKYDPGPR